MTDLECAAMDNVHELREALAIIRKAIKDCAPPGSVANNEYLLPGPGHEAEALVRGIFAVAERIYRN